MPNEHAPLSSKQGLCVRCHQRPYTDGYLCDQCYHTPLRDTPKPPTPDAAARHTEFKHYAFFKGYITTAREDGSIPLNSKAVCQLTVMSANGGDAGPTIAMIEQANLAPSFASRIAVLEGAARKVLSRLEYYASLGKDHADGSDVAPNIEDWAYTMGSSDIAELRTALASPARAEGETC